MSDTLEQFTQELTDQLSYYSCSNIDYVSDDGDIPRYVFRCLDNTIKTELIGPDTVVTSAFCLGNDFNCFTALASGASKAAELIRSKLHDTKRVKYTFDYALGRYFDYDEIDSDCVYDLNWCKVIIRPTINPHLDVTLNCPQRHKLKINFPMPDILPYNAFIRYMCSPGQYDGPNVPDTPHIEMVLDFIRYYTQNLPTCLRVFDISLYRDCSVLRTDVETLRAVHERHMEIFTSAGPKTLTHVYTDKGDYKTYQVTSSIISNYCLIRDTILSKAIIIGK